MPLIEFIGYSRAEATERMERYRPMFESLPFAKDFIYVIGEQVDLYGEPPFLRVRSRYQERIETTLSLLEKHESVEYFLINFRQKLSPP
jgi:hypothetical protein